LADKITVVVLSRPRDLNEDPSGRTGLVDEVQRLRQQAVRGPYRRGVPPVRPYEAGSFCAVETDWKFMPKIPGDTDGGGSGVVPCP